MQYIIIALSLIIVGLISYYIINKKKIINKTREDYLNQQRIILDRELSEEKQQIVNRITEMNNRCEEEIAQKKAFTQHIVEQCENAQRLHQASIEALDASLVDRMAQIDTKVAAYEEVEMQKVAVAIQNETDAEKDFATAGIALYWDALAQETVKREAALAELSAELEEWRKKRQAINEEIMRQRHLDEAQDYYRVCLSDAAIHDIQLLQSVKAKLNNHAKFDELIYDVYVAKSVQEMVKRALQGGEPSGIYKITRLKTGEVYIGKSTNVKKRWIEHCKTAFGNGTIAHSTLHTTMERDGIEHFTFELLEEVPKDKLTEREKYWINFYDSKDYGLNERNG